MRDEYNPQYYLADDVVWPFTRSIGEMTDVKYDDESFVCLDGEEAATACHALLADGVNNVRIPVTDLDGSRFEVGLRISYPGYHLGSDPCPGVTTLDPPPTVTVDETGPPLPTHIVDPLLLEAHDLGGGWTVSTISDVPAPPDLAPCPIAGEATAATATFDGWMMRTSSGVHPGGLELLQIVGFAGPDDGVDEVVDAIAPFVDCDQPFGDYGLTGFDSGDLVTLAEGVTSGSYWRFERAGRHVIVADIALDSRVVMVLGLTGDEPFGVDALEPYLAAASARLPVFADGLERCHADGPQRGRCRWFDDW